MARRAKPPEVWEIKQDWQKLVDVPYTGLTRSLRLQTPRKKPKGPESDLPPVLPSPIERVAAGLQRLRKAKSDHALLKQQREAAIAAKELPRVERPGRSLAALPPSSREKEKREQNPGQLRPEDARQDRLRRLSALREADWEGLINPLAEGEDADMAMLEELVEEEAEYPVLGNHLFNPEAFEKIGEFKKNVFQLGKKAGYSDAMYSIHGVPGGKQRRARYMPTLNEYDRICEFWEWCESRFGSKERAFKVIDLNGNGQLSATEFAQGCRSRGYPGNETTYKDIFFLFDADQDGSIGKPEFLGSKIQDPRAVESAQATLALETQQRKDEFAGWADPTGDKRISTNDVPNALGCAEGTEPNDGKTPIQRKREKLLATIARRDPFIAQFLEYLFNDYKTLKEAFRLIDLNGSRSVSKTEFKDGVFRLKKREHGKRPGPSFVEYHLSNLFSRLDTDGSGQISIQEMIEVEDSEDSFVQRLARYLLHVRSDFGRKEGMGMADPTLGTGADRRASTLSKSKRGSALVSPSTKRGSVARQDDDSDPIESLVKVFAKFDEDMSAVITEAEFTKGLKVLKYDVWQANDIFDRLDVNGSGSLSLGEFTAFLEKEARVRERTVVEAEERPRPPLFDAQAAATEAFQRNFRTGAHAMSFSMKLQRIGRRHKDEAPEGA